MSFRSVAIPLIRIDQVGGKLWGIRGRVAYGGDETDTGDADEDSDDEQRDARASGLHAFIGQVSVSCHSGSDSDRYAGSHRLLSGVAAKHCWESEQGP